MRTPVLIFAAMFAITACNNSLNTEQVKKIKDLAVEDSTRAVQANQKDSLITSYLNDLNEVQENLDRIKDREKIITSKSPEAKEDVLAEVKELDDWIVRNDKKLNSLQAKLKKENAKDIKLESLVAHLTQETAEKDEEIAGLQAKLSKADDSLRFVTRRFNDSIVVIKQQREKMFEMNSVYYVVGTIKQLQDKGVIDKQGGFVGLGRVAELNPDASTSVFVKSNLGVLKGISLNGKFRRVITTHPDKAYTIVTNAKSDSLTISDPASFWRECKFLVVAVKIKPFEV